MELQNTHKMNQQPQIHKVASLICRKTQAFPPGNSIDSQKRLPASNASCIANYNINYVRFLSTFAYPSPHCKQAGILCDILLSTRKLKQLTKGNLTKGVLSELNDFR